MKDKVRLILDKLDSANVTCINYDYYFNTFKKINGKWFAEWLNPMGLELEINDLVNDNVSAEIVELLQE